MLIDLHACMKKNGVLPRGIIHVGAHYGQEYDHYIQCGLHRIIFIEPLKKPFQILQNRFYGVGGVDLWNFACGSKPSEANMYVEEDNEGQSSSLLKPKEHLKEYPGIRFTRREHVQIFPLDFLNTNGCNLLMIDTQGAELEVLKGAKETLKKIDLVYAEVNNREMYEGCPMVQDIDKYLKDFTRVETKWYAKSGWGDAIYLKKKS